MYKKQMRFQKIVCLLCLVMAAVTFVYALGISTDLYDSLYGTMTNKNDPHKTKVEGSWIYYDIQDFNRSFVNYAIVLILPACLLYIMNTHTRRKYYITNYVSVALYSLGTVGVTVWSLINVSAFRTQYVTTVDFEALKEYAELWNSPYIDSTFWFDLGYVVGVLSILAVAALIVNTVWKVKLMNGEAALIKAGEEVAA